VNLGVDARAGERLLDQLALADGPAAAVDEDCRFHAGLNA
jgi:hypothetical protein